MHPSLAHTEHRPWPLPCGPWLWRMRWERLAFIHHRIDAAVLRPRIPPDLTVDEFDGSAWLGVVPFQMTDMMVRGLPGVPPWRRFPELNLRTYVVRDGCPGVWFFNLDAACWPLVVAGRGLYGFPYFRAAMRLEETAKGGMLMSRRPDGRAAFRGTYSSRGEVFLARPGTFEHWATERYRVYSGLCGRTRATDVHHRPWPLQEAEVEIQENGLFAASGLSIDEASPVVHYTSGVEVIAFAKAWAGSGKAWG
ncbi:hypothetical protein GALL_51950 [mine drainage metagenome]|uniref:DUF2071 domain-containing protein n=1 Tax=mine drainage metagenome TaxID=410659 RepID=A0A1J5TN05_9ZZZZ